MSVSQQNSSGSPQPSRARRTRAYVFFTLALTALWLIFSGKFDALHLTYGVISIVCVILLCRGLVTRQDDPDVDEVFPHLNWVRMLGYPPWLLKEIVLASFQVAWLILQPRMPIDPVLLRFRTGMQSNLAKVTLGNSITLTPGTFTLSIEDDVFLVHTIHPHLAGGLLDGSMQRKVAAVFGEVELPLEQMKVEVLRDMSRFAEEEL